ncbi:Fur family transcriptional regulator [Bittarella massiliensis (ex Durand et al. 2017)]|uniref:Fur family transcriptional regulator n=1 Tax=Bittarella massiliensis (ex Durand et al. 2017) TaxID=1720313 RepID=UPI00073EA686|nr:Fur family transcriptional regulator [Bittarella massiliensis (ex Durand et al. 2017)]
MENQMREEAAALLRQGGMRITRQRQLVLAALLQAGGPLTAEAVAECIGDPAGCNRSTVYRTLAALEERGLVYRRLGADGSALYALRREHHGHTLRCLVCGQTLSLGQCPLEGLEREIYETTGFLVQGHSLEFTGVCAGCREKTKK